MSRTVYVVMCLDEGIDNEAVVVFDSVWGNKEDAEHAAAQCWGGRVREEELQSRKRK